MYTFAIVALLAVGTVKLVDFLSDTLPMIKPFRSLLTFVVGIGAVLALDYSLFEGWELRCETAPQACGSRASSWRA
jgi:hypothetical protein